jgi:hypothetical protein
MAIHCTDEEIVGLLNQSFPTDALDAIVSHCSECESCMQRLELLASTLGKLDQLSRWTNSLGVTNVIRSIEAHVDGRLVTDPDARATSTSNLRFIDSVDKGGFGHIFRYNDETFQRPVAIKMLQDRWSNNSEIADRFHREMSITASIDHPGCPTVFGSGKTTDGRAFFWMQLISGPQLTSEIKNLHSQNVFRISRRNSNLRKLLQYFLQICSVIAAAHKKMILHRDLKPSNIRIHSLGHAVVLDWGLAIRKDETKGNDTDSSQADLLITRAGATPGTPLYMAPEVASGELNKISEATDIFGLGALLYEILSNHGPHEALSNKCKNQTELIEAIGKGSEIATQGLPPELATICQKAMAFKPENRYSSALELSESIEQWLAGEPITIHRYGPVGRLSLLVQRYPLISTMTLLATIAVVTTSLLSLRWRDIASKTETFAELQSNLAEKRFGLALTAYRDLATGIQYELQKNGESGSLRKLLLNKTTSGIEQLIEETRNTQGAELVSFRAKLELASILANEESDLENSRDEFKRIHQGLLSLTLPSANPEYYELLLASLRGQYEAEQRISGLKNMPESIDKYRSLAIEFKEKFPKNKSAVRAVANSFVNEARYLLDLKDDHESAINAYQIALNIWNRASQELQKEMAYDILLIRGELATALEKTNPAKSLLERQSILDRVKELCQNDPTPQNFRGLIIDWDNYAKSLRKKGDIYRAIEEFEQARFQGKQLVSRFPKDESMAMALRTLEHNLATAYRSNKMPEKALAVLNSHRITIDELLKTNPHLETFKDQAVTYILIANIQSDEEMWKEAMQSYDAFRLIRLHIFRCDPVDKSNLIELALGMKTAMRNLGLAVDVRSFLNDIDETIEEISPLTQRNTATNYLPCWASFYLERGKSYSQLYKESRMVSDIEKASQSAKIVGNILQQNPSAPKVFLDEYAALTANLSEEID